jgi:transglutaminase-like putative cysteine protease
MSGTIVRLCAFAGLAGFANLLCFTLIASPPLGRAAAVTAIGVALGAALTAIGRLGLARTSSPATRAAWWALAVVTAILGLGAAMAAAGLPLHYLPPGHWDELGARLDPALARINEIDVPYKGGATWIEMAILLPAPALTWLAAVLAFWPLRGEGKRRRLAALATLVFLYGLAVSWDSRPGELGLGIALLALMAAWLWGPRLRSRRAAAGAMAVVALAAALAVPAAARLDPAEAWWDYKEWNLFGKGDAVSFEWSHSYGPLDWPRKGTVMMDVESREARYWKTEVLDRFDGRGWGRDSGIAAGRPRLELRGDAAGGQSTEWQETVSITIRSLRTEFVPAPGTAIAFAGMEVRAPSTDGTTIAARPLPPGTSYSVLSYVPDPSPSRMREAPAYGPAAEAYTSLDLPLPGAEVDSAGGPVVSVSIPPWGSGVQPDPYAEQLIAAGPYRETYLLARRLTAGAPTPYDAARAVGAHLQSGYRYDENPGRYRYPLATFLGGVRSGYCQHFSGAMALMLRLVGIPSRVVSGFAPGSPRDDGSFRVTDFDAHSWVEVYFGGIGWVVFDPTPSAAPPPSQPAGAGAEGAAGPNPADRPAPRDAAAAPTTGTSSAGGGSGVAGTVAPLLGAALLIGGAGYGLLAGARRRRLAAGTNADAQLREVAVALPRLGVRTAGGSTLLALERRLAGRRAREAATYLAALREHRFGAAGAEPPGPAARRAFRRALAASRGWRARLRGYRLIPPGGPRQRTTPPAR